VGNLTKYLSMCTVSVILALSLWGADASAQCVRYCSPDICGVQDAGCGDGSTFDYGPCGCNPIFCGPNSCGVLNDGCGNTIDCGGCTLPETCGGGGAANQCGCAALTCGPTDCGVLNDGCGATINCGSCTAPNTCGGGGVPGQCGCTPNTCAPGQCGVIDNGCGVPMNCGNCAAPNTCGGGGTPNQCGCTPLTACGPGQCGMIADGCGGTLTCTCTAPDTCGGGGTPNQCGCTPLTCGPTACGPIANGCGSTINCTNCCGNGTVETAMGEQCDGTNLNGQTCLTQGFTGTTGLLLCNSSCRLDASRCCNAVNGSWDGIWRNDGTCGQYQPCQQRQVQNCVGSSCGGTCPGTRPTQFIACGPCCGNNVPEAGETCTSCPSDVSCCGNWALNTGEQCDPGGPQLNGQTCVTLGYPGGTLRCTTDCTFDVSRCTTTWQQYGTQSCYSTSTPGTNWCPTTYPQGTVCATLGATCVAGTWQSCGGGSVVYARFFECRW